MSFLEFLGLIKSGDEAGKAVKSPAEMSVDELLKEEASLDYDIKRTAKEHSQLWRKMEEIHRKGVRATSKEERLRYAEEYKDLDHDLQQLKKEETLLRKTRRLIKRIKSMKEQERRYKRPYLNLSRIQWEQIADLVRDVSVDESAMEKQLDQLLGVSERVVEAVAEDPAVEALAQQWEREALEGVEQPEPLEEVEQPQEPKREAEPDLEL